MILFARSLPFRSFALAAFYLSLASPRVLAETVTAAEPPKPEVAFTWPERYAPGSLSEKKYRWDHVPGESLALVGPCGVVWRLNFGPRIARPCFHPLATSDGRTLTWMAPPDHPGHCGLWPSWKLIDGIDYREDDAAGGNPAGATRIVAAEVRRADDHGAEVQLRLAYHPAGMPDRVVMTDVIDLTMDLPGEDGSYHIEWRQTTAASNGPVVLGRASPPEESGGYGGLGLRGSRFWRNVSAVSSKGAMEPLVRRQRADWISLTGQLDRRDATVSFFAHPSNPRRSTFWFVELRPETPFWYAGAAWLRAKPYTLKPGRPLVWRYLIRVDNDRLAQAQLAAEYRRFRKN